MRSGVTCDADGLRGDCAILQEAKEPKKQIGILADLNAVGKDVIAKILYDAGEINKMTYGQYQRHGKKAVKTETNAAEEPAESEKQKTAPPTSLTVPAAVIEMVKDTLAELKSAYGNAKKVVTQYEEMEAFLAAATADKAE